MTSEDVAAVSQLESTVMDGWSEDVIGITLNHSANHCFTARSNMQMCAFCSWFFAVDTANLDAISVAQDVRRRGVATKLLNYSMQQLRQKGASIFRLEVRSENTAAINLYKTLGFKQNGARKGFYKNPQDDAVLMELDDSATATLKNGAG